MIGHNKNKTQPNSPKDNSADVTHMHASAAGTDASLGSSLLPFAAGAFTLIIFLIDALTPLNIAIAVLYGAVILMASFTWSSRAIIVLTILCLTLTLIAYGIGHRLDFFGPAFGRCMVSLAAIAITAYLALKGQASKNAILQGKEALRKADRMKDEFLAMLAHELRNPLAPISSAAQYLKTAQPRPEVVNEVSDIIARQVDHLNGLVDDLLDVSRITRRMVTLRKEKLSLKQIVSEAVEQARPLIQASRHRFIVDLPPEPVFVFGDHKRLVQVVSNLLNNAVKYTPEGGELLLRMQVVGEKVIIDVHDTGIGMAPELIPHVFDWFVQAERGLDRAQGGLGIGLALARSLVELHGGQISCASAGLGKGSQFTVVLPRLNVPQAASDDAQEARQAPGEASKLRILVVDDNIQAARMLAMYLSAVGHSVAVEHGARSALERAQIERPDICLLDIGLPEIDGNELARRLRGDARTRHALLIAVSGYSQEQDKLLAMEAGFDHYLVKPVDTSKLRALLADAGRMAGSADDLQGEKAML